MLRGSLDHNGNDNISNCGWLCILLVTHSGTGGVFQGRYVDTQDPNLAWLKWLVSKCSCLSASWALQCGLVLKVWLLASTNTRTLRNCTALVAMTLNLLRLPILVEATTNRVKMK
jgi:hypothetical protein